MNDQNARPLDVALPLETNLHQLRSDGKTTDQHNQVLYAHPGFCLAML